MKTRIMKFRKVDDPVKDTDRITEIARLRLHEDQIDEVLDNYVKEVAGEFKLPIGLVSIILDDVQKFVASYGLDGWIAETNGSPVEWSFCANSVRSGNPFIVEDADNHDLVKDNPHVKYDNVKCYAGAPLVTKNGYIVGNLCVVGSEERQFNSTEIERLKHYARLVIEHIESRVS